MFCNVIKLHFKGGFIMKKIIRTILAIVMVLSVLSGCSSTDPSSDSTKQEASAETGVTGEAASIAGTEGSESENISSTEANSDKTDLTGKKLFVYCGAGMTKPFTEIVEAFQSDTGAEVEVTFGNAAQIISQMKASNQGDVFIAGDQGELTTIQDEYVADTESLVKHIPVMAVQSGNPKGITGLKDFAKEGIKVVLGDKEATPIGKIADKALTDAGVLEQVNIVARTTTAPEIVTALTLGQCDAVIVWKENTKADGAEILESEDMDKYIKTVPAATLKCSTNTETLEAFLTFLDSKEAIDIWIKYGYEVLN
jgi:molybdate transport system substrate-binding protein